jgi:hypothetical protein
MNWKLAAAALCFTAGVVSTPAQGPRVKVQVPFAFEAANKAMPAGEYEVWSERNEVLLRNSDGNIVAMQQSNRVVRNGGNSGQVVFHCYENHCFLSELWTADSEQGREVLESKSEREIAKHQEPQQFALLGKGQAKQAGK